MGHWGWLIAIYLFLGGLGAGAYLSSFAAEKGLLGNTTNLNRVGYYVSAPIVALGALLLITDLGQGLKKPWLISYMFINYISVMTWGIYILTAFILVAFIKSYFVWTQRPAPEALAYVGAILALATASYTGMLLSVVQAVPFWNSYLMPVLFVVSALSTGLSLTSLSAHFLEKSQLHGARLTQVHLWLVSVEIIVVAAFFAFIYFGNQGVAKLSANRLLTESLALPFWLLFVIVGLIGPMIFYVQESRNNKSTTRSLMKEQDISQTKARSEQAKSGVTDSRKSGNILLLCDGAVLVGGLTLRCLIIFAALPAWNGFLI